MNHLLVGTNDKAERLIALTKPGFLLIDDGPIADAFQARFKKIKVFDLAKHHINPMEEMDYKRARDFADVVYAASPQGENTLTVRNGRRALARFLLSGPSRLSNFPSPSETRIDAEKEAFAMIEDLLLSPLLAKIFSRPTNFSFRGNVVARLNRAEIGDFDAFVLASLLIGQAQRQIIIPDFSYYGRLSHMSLIRQNRLTCGVDYLDELDHDLRQAVLLIKNKHGSGCTFDDAETLAAYANLKPDPSREDNDYNRFINKVMA